MHGKHPLAKRLTFFVILPVLIAAGVGYWHLKQSLPQTQGEVVVPGVSAPVTVARDEWGTPHIRAASDKDAFFAIGFVHAQDRMWQLELQRRIASGRLSELFGRSSVAQDVWFRTLGLERSAHASWEALDPDARQSLQAYADGVNQWIASGQPLPPEFGLLGIKPKPWTVYDSLAWAKVFALNLGGNHLREMERLIAGQLLDPGRRAILFPEYPPADPAAAIALSSTMQEGMERHVRFQKSLEQSLQIGGRHVGSNAWAVSGRHTRDGAALLANDPHLGLQIPSMWYMASLKGDRLDVAGATLIGLPVIVFGRNNAIAWGGTNLMADAQDIYFEQTKPDDGNRYNANGEWLAFETRVESIEVRQDFPAVLRGPLRPVRIKVRSSRHGPIISDTYRVFDQPAALRWTALDSGDASYASFLRLNYAQDWTQFQEALRGHVAPALNLIYADRKGNIGRISAGRMPVRAGGDGTIPVPGWNDEHEWIGEIPFEAWPRSYNPKSGFVVSANNNPVESDYPYLITRDWAPPARADRISSLLAAQIAKGRGLDLSVMNQIQADTRSEPARRLLVHLLTHAPSTDQQRQAFTHLRKWQGDMDRNSQGATIFNAWMMQLRKGLLSDDVRGFWNTSSGRRHLQGLAEDVDADVVLRLLSDADGAWCDNRETTNERESCDEVIDIALDRALRELNKIEGDDSMRDWAWGDMHEALYRHVPFSEVRSLRGLFERRIGTGGSPDSVNVATYALDKSGAGYVQDFGAGFRQLFSLSPKRISHLYMNSTGQSGNVMSPHYDDMIEPFRDVQFTSMPSGAGPKAQALMLMPHGGNQRKVAR